MPEAIKECGVSADVPDWSREDPERYWDPGRRLLRSIRKYQKWRGGKGPVAILARWSSILQYRFWAAVTGAEIGLGTEIGGGLLIPHPNGIVINTRVCIGPNCLIFQQVTIGIGRGQAPPTLGGHVDIGAGAKILGGITIGDHAIIGANSVVLQDVPTGATVAGIPARRIDKG